MEQVHLFCLMEKRKNLSPRQLKLNLCAMEGDLKQRFSHTTGLKRGPFFHLHRTLNLLQGGEKLIKSAKTVTNREKFLNVRSVAAKAHRGKWLWCAKKPPKTETRDTQSTHHQRAHIRNAKYNMFAEETYDLVQKLV